MKKYLLFANDRYEPMGGWADFINSFDSIKEIIAFIKEYHNESFHNIFRYNENYFEIVDTTISRIVLEGRIGDIIDGKIVDVPE